MKKAMLVSVVLMLSVTIFQLPVTASDTESRIAEIKQQIADLQDELNVLEAGIMNESDSINDVTDNVEGNEVEILADYTLSDSIGWYTRHFIIVKNNTDRALSVSSNSMAYGANNELIGYDTAKIEVMGPKTTSVMYEAYETDKTIERYETDIEFTEPDSYVEAVNQNLSYEQLDIDGGAVFIVTNNGDVVAESVEGTALFYKGEELVSYDSTYFCDDELELKPGNSKKNQLDSYNDFDRIEFYLTGIHYDW